MVQKNKNTENKHNTVIPRLTSDPANEFLGNEDFFAVFGLG